MRRRPQSARPGRSLLHIPNFAYTMYKVSLGSGRKAARSSLTISYPSCGSWRERRGSNFFSLWLTCRSATRGVSLLSISRIGKKLAKWTNHAGARQRRRENLGIHNPRHFDQEPQIYIIGGNEIPCCYHRRIRSEITRTNRPQHMHQEAQITVLIIIQEPP